MDADNNSINQGLTLKTLSAKDLTRGMSRTVMPVTGFILLEACLGLFGNILILIVYSKYYKRSNFRYFVLCLAYVDLLSCLTTLPGEAYTQMNWYTFKSELVCKVKSFLNVFTIFASALTFLILASDRYRKICHPFSRQIEPNCALRLCLLAVVISVVMASPTAVLWGTQSYTTSTGNASVNVTICEKSDVYVGEVYPLVYMAGAYCLPVFIVMSFTATFNVIIARKLLHGARTNPSLRMLCENCEKRDHVSEEEMSCLEVSTEGEVDESHRVKEIYRKHSKQFWRRYSFPAGKASTKHIHCNFRRKPPNSVSHVTDVCDVNADIEETVNELNGISRTPVLEQNGYKDSNDNGVKCLADTKITTNEADHVNPTSSEISPVKANAGRSNGASEGRRYSHGTLGKSASKHQKNGFSNYNTAMCKSLSNLNTRRQRRTVHSSEIDISKADSITLRGLRQWKRWRQKAMIRKSLNSQRKTLIMIILSSVFILTMVIYFTLLLLIANVDSILRNMSTSKTVTFFFFWRLYFVNSLINPILYGLMDQRFRKGLSKLCCAIRLCR